MNIGTIASIGVMLKRASSTFTEKLPKMGFNKKVVNDEDFALQEVISGYDHHERILRKKINDSQQKLENIKNTLNNNGTKNFLFKKEAEGVRNSISTSLILLHEIEKILNDQSNKNARNNRQTLEFIIGEINESIVNINLEDEVDYSTLNNISTIFVAISVAVWTYLVNTDILAPNNFSGISIPFFLNLLPLLVQTLQFTAIQVFRVKNGDSSAIVKIYQSILPALNDIKELLYEEEINSTLATVQQNCEAIIAQQREHEGKENNIFEAIQKLSENNRKDDILENKVMQAAMKNPDLEYDIKRTLIQGGENKKYIYKIFDAYRQKKYYYFSTPCSTSSNSSYSLLNMV